MSESDEPVYNPAIHTSLWFDDLSTYSSLADMQAGTGAHTWQLQAGNYPGADWSEQRFYVGGGRNGTNGVASVYRVPEGFTAYGWNPGEMSPVGAIDGGANPDVIILSMYVKVTGGGNFKGKFGIRKEDSSWTHWLIMATGYSPPQPSEIVACYWSTSWPFAPIDPVNTPGYQGGQDRFTIAYTRYVPTPYGYYTNTGLLNYVPAIHGTATGGIGWPNDDTFHRFTMRLTKGPTATRGRIEMWLAGVKINDWDGNDPAKPEYDKVNLPTGAQRLLPNWSFFSEHKVAVIPAQFEIRLDEARVYTPR